jgi:uncharacterized protein (DUF362 family)
MQLSTSYSGLGELWLPRTVLDSDFIVSMPKVKTHHWAGVTLSLKNMFGIVPGMKYGWPKNLLHWHGIHECILDICATVPIHFVIADGISAMEGNGPLQGTARDLGKIVLADDPIAADATLFLQVADSGAVDLPALAPISFGISSFRGGSAHETR